VTPNPAFGEFRVAFALDGASPATLELIDLAGRRLRVERLGELPAGEHSLPLSGLDVSPGLYWLRLAQGAKAVTRKVAVVR
jgi:hypothetical protein